MVDRIFARVGASDDLINNRSTFVIEMQEAAAFLNQATERSLVIVDELGRFSFSVASRSPPPPPPTTTHALRTPQVEAPLQRRDMRSQRPPWSG